MANEVCGPPCEECGACCAEVVSVRPGKNGMTAVIKCLSCEHVQDLSLEGSE